MTDHYRIPVSGGWSGSAPPPPPAQPESPPRKRHGAGLVVAVQSIACVAVLLMALLLKAAGGEPYEQLCARFQEYLQRNDLLAAVAALWDGDPLDEVSSRVEEIN